MIQANVEAIKNVMSTFKVDMDKAMDALKIPQNDRPLYASYL